MAERNNWLLLSRRLGNLIRRLNWLDTWTRQRHHCFTSTCRVLSKNQLFLFLNISLPLLSIVKPLSIEFSFLLVLLLRHCPRSRLPNRLNKRITLSPLGLFVNRPAFNLIWPMTRFHGLPVPSSRRSYDILSLFFLVYCYLCLFWVKAQSFDGIQEPVSRSCIW